MARSHDDGGDGREATKALSGEEGREMGLGKTDKKRKRMGAEAPPPPPAPSQDHRATSSADDGLDYARAIVDKSVREILAIKANRVPSTELFERLTGERDHSVENTFGDSDDGSLESLQARKVALLVSKSIASLSSYAGGKRIRVCSGFAMCQTDTTGTSMILTSTTLIRSLNGDNDLIPDVKVKVLLSDGHITDGHIFLVDFHYNVVVVKVAADLALLEAFHLKGTTHSGAVLALGRAYEGGKLMCSRGEVVNRTSIFGCSELLVSSCKISMAGSGGPLVNYNGQVLGINFYEKNQTSHLPMLIVSRILEQHQSFGKTISPWLGLKYTSLQMMPLSVLERIYQKFPDVDEGLYISKVAEGSPADVSGLCVGDVLVKCSESVLSSAPEFGAMLLDACKDHLEAFGDCAWENMMVEVVIKRRRDGSTVSKSIAAEVLKESHYNRWPAPMPNYRPRLINITSCRGPYPR
ncbi:serine protease Do-like HtrA [Lolium rigidum]|uniref:serine protease Do-like HtrA n=1 Tax=Lolium rigidum TaxID=89674 RepID=UPI001F5C33A8|nr:serine protease Do-like HtrA [Lolium rigidum]